MKGSRAINFNNGGWTNRFEKICKSQIGSFPRDQSENPQTYLSCHHPEYYVSPSVEHHKEQLRNKPSIIEALGG